MTLVARTRMIARTSAAVIALTLSNGLSAQTAVDFEGTVVASCVMTVSTTGVLALNTTGTELGSEQSGGNAAVVGITATGGAPTIKFTAPALSLKPGGYTRAPTVSLKYTSSGGANQAYTAAPSQYTSNSSSGDTVTLHAKAVDSSGFTAGIYQLRTTATCQQ